MSRALLAIMLAVAVGCSSAPSSGPDASIDAAPVVDLAVLCSGADACASCFSNDDCPPAETCHSFDSTGERIYCVPGARGTSPAGAPCTSEADCASALCIESDKAGHLCSALCVDAGSCPPALPRCIYIGFGVDRSICSP